jgi:hypothetical protein
MAELPKELYLLVGTIVGALVSLLTVMLTTRGQLRLARENHEHQARLETQKLDYQARKEEFEHLRSKIEEAELIVLKLSMMNSPTGSDIARDGGISITDHDAQYLKLDEEARRLQMLADLYFPDVYKAASALRGQMNVFWGTQRQRLYQQSQAFIDEHREMIAEDPSFQEEVLGRSWVEIRKISREVAAKAWEVQQGLIRAAQSLRQYADDQY